MSLVSLAEKKKYSGTRRGKSLPMLISCSIIFLLIGMAISTADVSQTVGVFWSRIDDTIVLTNESENVNIGQNETTIYRLHVNGTSYFVDVMTVNDIIIAYGGNSTEWNLAHMWGNHSLVGYLMDWSNGDPFFNNSDAYYVTSILMDNWNESYSWGNHSLAGYLTEGIAGFWNRSNNILYTATDSDNVQINATLVTNKINLRNDTKSWDMYTNETGVMIWEWV